jgi:hypothetical protein
MTTVTRVSFQMCEALAPADPQSRLSQAVLLRNTLLT